MSTLAVVDDQARFYPNGTGDSFRQADVEDKNKQRLDGRVGRLLRDIVFSFVFSLTRVCCDHDQESRLKIGFYDDLLMPTSQGGFDHPPTLYDILAV